jgi:ATP-dependent DNA helicase RecG
MNEKELQKFLLKNFSKENESCEWKSWRSLKNAISSRKGDDAISYISAISNMNGGHLVVGVEDKTLEILGIADFADYSIENIKFRIVGNCSNLNSDKFEIQNFVTSDTKKTVWIFCIPKHSFRLPVYAHKKSWQRIGDNLIEMTKDRLDAILNETSPSEDWSSEIISTATILDLDPAAIVEARKQFIVRNPKYTEEIGNWDDAKFLNKAKLTIKGQITRTSLILLGKEESAHFLESSVKILWELRTLNNQIKGGEVFSIPFILAVDEVFTKIRNLKYVHLGINTLFPDEFLRYEPFSIRESINNAIAHQDYEKRGRINVIEFEDDHLVFSNCGSFLPKSVENVVLKDSPEEIYRNHFLVEAMKNLNMVETHGGGIKKIFNFQRKRLFPMPDYDFSDGKVKVKITGKVIDEEFSKILKERDLELSTIILLDQVQKKLPINLTEVNLLKKGKLIDGKKGQYFISAKISEIVGQKARYIKNRAFDNAHYKAMILKFLDEWNGASRKDIDDLLLDKLSDVLSEKQKKIKINNLLNEMAKRDRSIKNYGTRKTPEWRNLINKYLINN